MCHNEISATRNDIILWLFRGGTTDVNAFSWEALGACLFSLLWVAWMYGNVQDKQRLLLVMINPAAPYWAALVQEAILHILILFSKVWSLPPGPVRVWIIDLALFHQPWLNHSAALCVFSGSALSFHRSHSALSHLQRERRAMNMFCSTQSLFLGLSRLTDGLHKTE